MILTRVNGAPCEVPAIVCIVCGMLYVDIAWLIQFANNDSSMTNNYISVFRVIAAIALISFNVSAYAAELTGPIDKFTDGDTFVIWKQAIRLADIDAPEFSQNCKNSAGKSYNCGAAALNYLKKTSEYPGSTLYR